MRSKRKVFLIDENSHHGLRENLQNFFNDFDVIDIDSRSRASLQLLYEYTITKPDQVYTIISVGERAFTFFFDNRFMHEKTDIPIVFLAADSPADYRRRNINKIPFDFSRVIVASMCEEWDCLWKKHFKPTHTCIIDGSVFAQRQNLPLGDQSATWATRSTTAVLPAHLIHYSSYNTPLNSDGLISLASTFGERYQSHFRTVAEAILNNDNLELLALIEMELKEDPEFQDTDSHLNLYYHVNAFIKLRRREALIVSLLKQPVVFHGDGYPEQWKTIAPNRFGSVTSRDLSSVFVRGRMIIDPPQVCNTIHDRMIYGIRCGMVPLTKANSTIKRWFRHGENVLFYENADDAARLVGETLADPEKSFQIAKNAYSTLDNYQIEHQSLSILNGVICKVRKERNLP